jgi:L-alanine-DL-glutamate epimerase-like enolase superfamily enzyme
MAVLDALGRHLGMPLWSLFGGAGTELETDLTVTTGSIDRARGAAAAIAARGFSTIKVKIGAASLDEDVARLAAVHEAAPAARLIADANGALDAATALALCEALRARGIALALFEQPTPAGDLDALAEVTRRSGFAVAADETQPPASPDRACSAARASPGRMPRDSPPRRRSPTPCPHASRTRRAARAARRCSRVRAG